MDAILHQGNLAVVRCSIYKHLWESAKLFFHFQFMHSLVELTWFFQKVTRTGDFGPKGYFYMNGYITHDGYTKPDCHNDSPTKAKDHPTN